VVGEEGGGRKDGQSSQDFYYRGEKKDEVAFAAPGPNIDRNVLIKRGGAFSKLVFLEILGKKKIKKGGDSRLKKRRGR